MESPNAVETEKSELQAKLESVIEKAKQACERLQDQTAVAARAADRTIRDNPYQAIGVAFGVGVLIGALAMGSRRH